MGVFGLQGKAGLGKSPDPGAYKANYAQAQATRWFFGELRGLGV